MNARHDGNGVHTLIAVETDGKTLVNIEADPSAHTLHVSDGSSGSDNGPYNSRHDDSHVPTLLAVASRNVTINNVTYIQGVTPVVVYGDSNGNLLVEST